MSEPENFIARWSRRKRNAAEEAKPATSTNVGEEPRAGSDPAPVLSGASESSEAAFDLTKLPPIETITADTDIRAFLAPGVPAELTRAALRRAWSADPKIRDFIGLSENSWDFNDPGAMHGFGPLELTEEIRQEIARMIGRSLGEDVPDAPGPARPDVAEPGPEPPPAQAKSAMLAPPAGT